MVERGLGHVEHVRMVTGLLVLDVLVGPYQKGHVERALHWRFGDGSAGIGRAAVGHLQFGLDNVWAGVVVGCGRDNRRRRVHVDDARRR